MRRMSLKEKYFSSNTIKGLFKFIFIAFPMYIIANILKRFNAYKDIWIIAERVNEARDNGYHMFKYIRENHTGIKCYYVIDFKSKDYKNLKMYGNLINFYSIKHYLYYYLASKHISTHGAGYGLMPDFYACRLLEALLPSNKKKIYLKHGILYNYIEGLTKKRSQINLFITGAVPEYEFVKNNFGYTDQEVKYIGLARFDKLVNQQPTKSRIMIMFTWRRWLLNLDDKGIQKSDYFKRIKSLLRNQKLNLLLKEHDLKLDFCLHPKFQNLREIISDNNLKGNINIIDTDNINIQNLLMSADLLITDYSSVFFDFAYMKKPIIYYQFDHSRFTQEHYYEGYFDYNKHGFGPIINDEENLLCELEKIIEGNFEMEQTFIKRIEYFFPRIDANNRKRNFEEIKKL